MSTWLGMYLLFLLVESAQNSDDALIAEYAVDFLVFCFMKLGFYMISQAEVKFRQLNGLGHGADGTENIVNYYACLI